MALNKAKTSVWVKTLIVVLIVAFISMFMYSGISGLFDLFKNSGSSTPTSTVDPVTAINQEKQPTVDALKQLAASEPTSYTAQVNLANAIYDWAQALSRPASGQSQLTTAAMVAAAQQWSNARAAYDAATKLKAYDPSVQTDRSIATFYSGDATAAVKIVRTVTTKTPTFAPAWLNLAVFYDQAGNSLQALVAYKKYVALDPKGSNVSYAQQRIKALSGSSVTATP